MLLKLYLLFKLAGERENGKHASVASRTSLMDKRRTQQKPSQCAHERKMVGHKGHPFQGVVEFMRKRGKSVGSAADQAGRSLALT
jgi:hypothetical protein